MIGLSQAEDKRGTKHPSFSHEKSLIHAAEGRILDVSLRPFSLELTSDCR